jgi:hypothetical protein
MRAGGAADVELVADNEGGDLGTELLFGEADAAEGVREVSVPAGMGSIRSVLTRERGRRPPLPRSRPPQWLPSPARARVLEGNAGG